MEGCYPAEELPVPLGRGPGPVDDHHVGVMGQLLHHCACLGPLARFQGVGLVLYHNCVSHTEGREGFGPNCQPFLHLGMALGKGLLPEVSFHPPLPPRLVLGVDSWQGVTQDSAEEDHAVAEASQGVRGVAVAQQGPNQPVCV